ncbi:hypothetical protein [Burkholderia thailandensis]|uniref:hypothetical protein n=1 Tax=Burkholderia thailandensis TaxID=57975 RepID=UPI00201249FC|nr:hypothetical protein [Burkholderia thailandensis]
MDNHFGVVLSGGAIDAPACERVRLQRTHVGPVNTFRVAPVRLAALDCAFEQPIRGGRCRSYPDEREPMRAAPKRYLVAITSPDGKSVELFPMLQWCRDNPDKAPTDLVFRGRNSRALRRAFEGMGWVSSESDTEVRLTPPDSSAAVGPTAPC